MYVDAQYWKPPIPVITSTTPYHDQRFLSNTTQPEEIAFSIQFSEELDCDKLKKQLSLGSQTLQKEHATFGPLSCQKVVNAVRLEPHWGSPRSAWEISGSIVNIAHGVHWIDLEGGYTSTTTKVSSFPGRERIIFRIGKADNPMVFPRTATYSATLLQEVNGNDITLRHNAAGATKFRYSTNWRSTWSNWTNLTTQLTVVPKLSWQGTKRQTWQGTHVIVEYWAQGLWSAHHYQHSDSNGQNRQWPHLFAQGKFNRFYLDSAINTKFEHHSSTDKNYTWSWDFMAEWPSNVTLNVWGLNPDEAPDSQHLYGDVDGDYVLDRVPPTLVQQDNVLIFDRPPPSPYLSYQIQVNDVTRRWWFEPKGQRWVQIM